jgi:hypothetical protein
MRTHVILTTVATLINGLLFLFAEIWPQSVIGQGVGVSLTWLAIILGDPHDPSAVGAYAGFFLVVVVLVYASWWSCGTIFGIMRRKDPR